ncbi:hypothetical protein NIES267_17930 [Calothrix parasitica NIES-267]|uniref:Uncharacterized protein n=1 Tax=Calothrix parasitica NIES-267 TaxID=1973488 RepID=A0A1Z4LMB7_9CYAN|nr:hypothetical protein NIES267_17930 [Calothrix parasitica NIES-267]
MARRLRRKLCSLCNQSELVLYRIKHIENGDWVFVCSQCWETVSQNNPFYIYGGTWKSKKK